MSEPAIEFHEAADIFPLDEGGLDTLADDIRTQGQQVRIETLGGKIIDGRRRYRACQRAGVEPRFREVEVADPVAYVLSLNLHRRHLSPTQLAMVGARARELYDREAEKRRLEAASRAGKASGASRRGESNDPENLPEGSTGDARDQAGKAVGVSGKTIDAATKILAHGTPKLVAAVDADLIAVSTAVKAASLSDGEQDALADRATERGRAGHKTKRRPKAAAEPTAETEETQAGAARDGVGIRLAHEALNSLTRIPKDDPFRKQGFQIVTDWIRHNK